VVIAEVVDVQLVFVLNQQFVALEAWLDEAEVGLAIHGRFDALSDLVDLLFDEEVELEVVGQEVVVPSKGDVWRYSQDSAGDAVGRLDVSVIVDERAFEAGVI
jgi:hypothetical protein